MNENYLRLLWLSKNVLQFWQSIIRFSFLERPSATEIHWRSIKILGKEVLGENTVRE